MKRNLLVLFISSVLLSSCSSFFQLVNVSPSSKMEEISFTTGSPDPKYRFFYADTVNNDYLRKLRNDYQLEQLVSGCKADTGKILDVLNWTSQQWEHNGSNTPTKSDALTILKEAQEGKQFRCVEYGIVANTALNSLGIRARTLGLKTRDVEKVRRGAGHVVAEVYSKDLGKWIYIDPQFNIMPVLNGTPLNGVEFQQAIYSRDAGLKLINKQGEIGKTDAENYIKWVGKYLYYFDILFDQQNLNSEKYQSVNGKTKLMLVPAGSTEPDVFQRKYPITYCHYTHSLNDFYQKPE